MSNAIILHGTPPKEEYYDLTFPSSSNSHWLPWLQKQLLAKDIFAVTPEVPNSYKTIWEVWKREVERFEIDENTILVGHSCGGGFWIRYLSENHALRVGKVVLIAPSLGYSWPEEKRQAMFSNFKIDKNLTSRTSGLTIFHSIDDMEGIQKSVEVLRGQIKGVTYKEFQGYGHFTYNDMKTGEFPELLTEISN